MKVYEFGIEENPEILLLPGTCCHWDINFGKVIPLLKQDFHVLCVSYDGFDETEDSIFPDMITETEKIEQYLIEKLQGKICAAYGCSLGGSFVSLLVQRKKVQIAHAIIGSSDMDQDKRFPAWIKGKLVTCLMNHMIEKEELPGFMKKRLDKKDQEDMQYFKNLIELFGLKDERTKHIKKQSIFNQFYSDLITPVEDHMEVPGTTIHIFYAEKMGEQYEKRYLQHFAAPDIIRQNLQHEELLFCYPEKWAELVKNTVKK